MIDMNLAGELGLHAGDEAIQAIGRVVKSAPDIKTQMAVMAIAFVYVQAKSNAVKTAQPGFAKIMEMIAPGFDDIILKDLKEAIKQEAGVDIL